MTDETPRSFVDDIHDRLDAQAVEHEDMAEEIAVVRRYIELHRDLLERLPEAVIQDIVHAALLRARGGVGTLPPIALSPDEINQALRENANRLDRLIEKRRSLNAFVDGLVQVATAAVLRLLAAVLVA